MLYFTDTLQPFLAGYVEDAVIETTLQYENYE